MIFLLRVFQCCLRFLDVVDVVIDNINWIIKILIDYVKTLRHLRIYQFQYICGMQAQFGFCFVIVIFGDRSDTLGNLGIYWLQDGRGMKIDVGFEFLFDFGINRGKKGGNKFIFINLARHSYVNALQLLCHMDINGCLAAMNSNCSTLIELFSLLS